jgi:hypothetical protein
MGQTLYPHEAQGMVAGAIDRAETFHLQEHQGLNQESGIVVGFITLAVPCGLLSGTNFMKRKSPLREPKAKQNKSATSTAFRTNSDCGIGKGRKSLPEIATVGAKHRDIDARDE